MGGLQMQLIWAYQYYLYAKRHPDLLKKLSGSRLLLALTLSSYVFFKTDFNLGMDREAAAIKIGSHLTTNALLGAAICNFLINFLPQVNLSLVLPTCFCAAFFDSSLMMKTYRPGLEGTGSVIAWFYSNETAFAAANLFGFLGVLTGLGLVMLTPSYKWVKGDAM